MAAVDPPLYSPSAPVLATLHQRHLGPQNYTHQVHPSVPVNPPNPFRLLEKVRVEQAAEILITPRGL